MRIRLLLFQFFWIVLECIAQDTIYYDIDGKKVAEIQLSDHFEIVTNMLNKEDQIRKTFYSSNLKIRSVEISVRKEKKYTSWYQDGQIKSETSYDKHKRLTGNFRTFWPDGSVKRDDYYKKSKLLHGKCYNEKGEEITHFDYYIHPQFPGGDNSQYEYLKKEIRKQQCEGTGRFIKISYWVNKDGTVSDAIILRSICEEIDNEVLRITLMMPQWTPAYLDGEPVAKEVMMQISRGFFK